MSVSEKKFSNFIYWSSLRFDTRVFTQACPLCDSSRYSPRKSFDPRPRPPCPFFWPLREPRLSPRPAARPRKFSPTSCGSRPRSNIPSLLSLNVPCPKKFLAFDPGPVPYRPVLGAYSAPAARAFGPRPRIMSPTPEYRFGPQCFRCRSFGHLARDCSCYRPPSWFREREHVEQKKSPKDHSCSVHSRSSL